MTGRDYVATALRLIGALAPGESAEASEAADGLASLNRMLGSWSNENLLVYSRVRETFTLTSSVASYTLGTGGTLNTTRPVSIERAFLRDASSATPIEYEIHIASLEEWQSTTAKDVNGIPSVLYADGAYPLMGINLYPRPSQAYSLGLWSLKELTAISTLDTVVSMPAGYEEALIYNLAIRLAPEYGKTTPAEVVKIATDAKANVKRTNHTARYMKVDPALVQQASAWNQYKGDFGR
jgi:hypothetical protein